MYREIEDILQGSFDFSDEDIVIGNILELLKYSNNIVKYFNESTHHIPSYEGYKEKIIQNSKIVQEAIDKKNTLASTHLTLLNSQEELEKRQNEVDEIKASILKIKNLKLEYESVNIEELKKENRRLLREHTDKYKEVEEVNENNKVLQSKIESLNKSIEELNTISIKEIEKAKMIFNKIDRYITDNWDGIDHRFTEERKRFKTLTTQYNELLNDVDDKLIAIGLTKKELNEKEKELSTLSDKYKKLQKIYNTEFEQNSKYIHMNSLELDSLSEELKDRLSKFNLILGEVIDRNEKIKNKIREANR